jgi:hypothetical protein
LADTAYGSLPIHINNIYNTQANVYSLLSADYRNLPVFLNSSVQAQLRAALRDVLPYITEARMAFFTYREELQALPSSEKNILAP